MNSLLSDLRYAGREVRKRPRFTLTAVLSLALGIGATSAVFSVIYAVLLDPFPYPDAARMMEIRLQDKAGHDQFAGLNGPEIQQLRKTNSLEDVVGLGGWNLTTTDGDIPEDVRACEISPNAPNHWGMRALMGRWLIPPRRAIRGRRAAGGRARLSVLAEILRWRSEGGRADDPIHSQAL
jgi:hypothetical protein